ncbi:cellulose binding domain-containing protein [Salinispora oceanensis]|uniref:cellulose binding domain-containing protein n=2 Tax=Salinispora oceanensis TaxID=1050199 RepID=UPI00039ADB92|nr:cellulose-binding domain-containing protein [Salinispora oceanensis]
MTESSKPGDTPADEVGVRLPEWPPLASYDEPTEVPKRATSNLGDSPHPDGVPQPNSGAQPNRRSQPEEADRGPDSSGRRPLRPVKGSADARRSIPARLRSQGIVAASFLGIILTAAALNALQRSPADPSSRLTIDSVASTAASPAAAPSESSPTQSLPLPPTPTPTHVPTQTPTQAPTSPPVAMAATTQPPPSETATQNSTQPASSAPSEPPALPPPPADCTTNYTIIESWPGGFKGEVKIKNNTSTSWTGWRVEWTWPSGQKLTEVWNGSLSSSGASVTVTNMSYNGTLAPDGTTTFGFLADITGTNPAPTMTCAGR